MNTDLSNNDLLLMFHAHNVPPKKLKPVKAHDSPSVRCETFAPFVYFAVK